MKTLPKDMDIECIELCNLLNSLPTVETMESCCGHCKDEYSEISCLPCVEGITWFLKDKFNEPGFDYEQFIKDAYEIQEVRGLLYEHRWEGLDNHPKSPKESDNFHYHVFGKVIEKMFDGFAKKYGLWINKD